MVKSRTPGKGHTKTQFRWMVVQGVRSPAVLWQMTAVDKQGEYEWLWGLGNPAIIICSFQSSGTWQDSIPQRERHGRVRGKLNTHGKTQNKNPECGWKQKSKHTRKAFWGAGDCTNLCRNQRQVMHKLNITRGTPEQETPHQISLEEGTASQLLNRFSPRWDGCLGAREDQPELISRKIPPNGTLEQEMCASTPFEAMSVSIIKTLKSFQENIHICPSHSGPFRPNILKKLTTSPLWLWIRVSDKALMPLNTLVCFC